MLPQLEGTGGALGSVLKDGKERRRALGSPRGYLLAACEPGGSVARPRGRAQRVWDDPVSSTLATCGRIAGGRGAARLVAIEHPAGAKKVMGCNRID
jgi:hypothetical protein